MVARTGPARWIGLAVIGLGGLVVLMRLGLWQLDRLEEKTAYIAQIEAGMAAEPVALPSAVEKNDAFLAVEVSGTVGAGALQFVHSATEYGLVVPLETGSRRILADLGLVAPRAELDLEGMRLDILGNIVFPEGDAGTLRRDQPNAWGQRNVAAMAEELDTEPVLVVARTLEPQPGGVQAFPVTTEGIPNNHMGYAIQWFGIAVAWAGMTLLLGWRMARRSE